VLGPWSSAVGVLVTLALSAAAVVARALTPGAAVVAGVFGSAIVIFAGFGFLFLLTVFVVVSSLATRYRFAEKTRRHVQEGRAGERGVSNVLAHIVLPTGIAVGAGLGWIPLGWAGLLFASAISFAAADTLAGEFGVLTGSAVSILTLRPVTPGTNGGVSSVGEMFAISGSVGTALVGFALFGLFGPLTPSPRVFVVGVAVAGFVACQVDSVLGETLENRGLLSKGATNFLAMLSAIALGGWIVQLTGTHL